MAPLENYIVEHCAPTLACLKTGTLFCVDIAETAELLTAAEFGPERAAACDAIAFGCPAMGAEQLEEDEFEPMFTSCKAALKGKRIALFGSYGWGDGEWMRSWETTAKGYGAVLVTESVICADAPDAAAVSACEALGRALA